MNSPERERAARMRKRAMGNIPSIDMTATGENITKLRMRAGLTVRDLQEFFGVATPQAIYKWQQGTTMPALDNLVGLSVILGVSMDEIIVRGK